LRRLVLGRVIVPLLKMAEDDVFPNPAWERGVQESIGKDIRRQHDRVHLRELLLERRIWIPVPKLIYVSTGLGNRKHLFWGRRVIARKRALGARGLFFLSLLGHGSWRF